MKNESKEQRIKVCIIDDDLSSRNSLKDQLSKDDRIWFYGEYNSGESFLKAFKSPFSPDVCLIDIKLSEDPDGVQGMECAKRIKEKSSDIHVIIITAYPDAENFAQAREIGADYIEKGTRGEVLIDKIITSRQNIPNETSDEEQIISIRLSNQDKIDLPSLIKQIEDFIEDTSRLSPMQKKVLTLQLSGMSVDTIAKELDIEPVTVRTHLDRAKSKGAKAVRVPNLWEYIKL
ncbi:MAG TPA: response regulator transcription factor [Spirochaetes bacterium]|nr:response regulator transcription factor [Spirochaetota bacterium]